MEAGVPGGEANAAVGQRVDVRRVRGRVARDAEVADAEVICRRGRVGGRGSGPTAACSWVGMSSCQGGWARVGAVLGPVGWGGLTGEEHEDVGLGAAQAGRPAACRRAQQPQGAERHVAGRTSTHDAQEQRRR